MVNCASTGYRLHPHFQRIICRVQWASEWRTFVGGLSSVNSAHFSRTKEQTQLRNIIPSNANFSQVMERVIQQQITDT